LVAVSRFAAMVTTGVTTRRVFRFGWVTSLVRLLLHRRDELVAANLEEQARRVKRKRAHDAATR
jgi:hypothetical protein